MQVSGSRFDPKPYTKKLEGAEAGAAAPREVGLLFVATAATREFATPMNVELDWAPALQRPAQLFPPSTGITVPVM